MRAQSTTLILPKDRQRSEGKESVQDFNFKATKPYTQNQPLSMKAVQYFVS
jgi:hypothetical protein